MSNDGQTRIYCVDSGCHARARRCFARMTINNTDKLLLITLLAPAHVRAGHLMLESLESGLLLSDLVPRLVLHPAASAEDPPRPYLFQLEMLEQVVQSFEAFRCRHQEGDDEDSHASAADRPFRLESPSELVERARDSKINANLELAVQDGAGELERKVVDAAQGREG